ncbi:MAG: hypothetical protein COC06_01500 [Bacteroidales bacterium]|nr:MAG: hypothetical protein COC06_01500 [Bacteroidales bacterium]
MKQLFNYTALVLAIILFSSCDKNFESFEESDSYQDIPSDIATITSESLPGQILLKWVVPADSNYYFVRVNYYDHLTEKDVYKVASVHADSLLIDNTRAKYGDYDFTFQTYNRNNQGGEPTSIKAKSGKAIATQTITTFKIELTADQLSTNNQEPSEGPIANLVDGDVNSFFHTRWSSPQIPMPQYIEVKLNEPHQVFQFYYQNRNGSQVGAEILEVQISNDGQTWESLTTIDVGLPSGSKAEYTSEIFQPANSFTYFRYNVLQTYGSRNYFNMAEFALYDVVIDIYDPEL